MSNPRGGKKAMTTIMSRLVPSPVPLPVPAGSAKRFTVDELYDRYEDKVYRRTDRFFFILMVLQWVVGILFAVLVSPRAWSGATSSVHPHIYAAVLLGGVFCFFPIILIWRLPGQANIMRSEEHTSELQSLTNLVCRLLLEKKKTQIRIPMHTQNT